MDYRQPFGHEFSSKAAQLWHEPFEVLQVVGPLAEPDRCVILAGESREAACLLRRPPVQLVQPAKVLLAGAGG